MLTFNINGQSREVDTPEDMPLLWVLRDHLNLVGTKYGCGVAQCGACTVHVDGKPVRSCQLTVGDVGTRAVTTIEGIGNTPNGAKVQQAWMEAAVPAMRLLPGRPDHVGHGAARQQPPPRRFRYRRGHGGQSLPLRHLYPHPPGDQKRRRQIGLNMKKTLGIAVAVIVVLALGFAGWLVLGRDRWPSPAARR